MEKGFVTSDKGGKHYQFDANVTVIATANPKGDRFAGWTVGTLRKQLLFDPALLSRLHLVFLIRKLDLKEFVEISRKIIRQEPKKSKGKHEELIQGYVKYAEPVEVKVPKQFEQQIVVFVSEMKKNEKKYL
jgi:DNA replicative helicase MCM subunit Mcm2 (Cdc46/Mcm family)